MKNVYTLVSDIYKLMETKEVAEGVDLEAAIDLFGENVKDLMRNEFGGRKRDGRKLRMSNIGREDRYLWKTHEPTYFVLQITSYYRFYHTGFQFRKNQAGMVMRVPES